MKKLLTILFAVALGLNLSAQVPDYVPTEGLVAWYPLDGDLTNEVNLDESSLLIGGSFVPGQANDAEGALSFSANSWAEIHPLIGTTETLTVHLWINEGTNPPNEIQTALYLGQEGFLGDTTTSLDISRDRVNFPGNGRLRSNLNYDFGHVGFDELDGGWVHVLTVFDSGVLSIYRNGLLQQSTTASVSGISINGTSTLGAGHVGTNSEPFNFCHCALDNIGIWNRALTEEEILALYNAPAPAPGCTDPTACNFNEEANIEDDSCVYPLFGEDCETGGAACGEGTIWDSSLQSCVGFDECPSDLNDDGIVGINDLLSLLSDFGMECPPEMAEWTCGDLMNYHGYDYATVQIGEQCWFAENLRTELYQNGDSIPNPIDCPEWSSVMVGARCDIDNDAGNVEFFGRLYNWFSTNSSYGLCPNEWHVPTDGEWIELEVELGMSLGQAQGTYYRGTDQGDQLKSQANWNGSNSSGFEAVSTGYRGPYLGCEYSPVTSGTWFWTSTGNGSLAVGRGLSAEETGIVRMTSYQLRNGFSVRCLKDTEE